ncbi:MAG: polymer-forming cytoskeletal protein [Deltaproteobacteria bacterium]|nr:polymer-forming cytoskeletal protein [Deltaproteobacteria bacterium]
MAWFDRNVGGKKGQEEERPVVHEAPAAPVTAAPTPTPPPVQAQTPTPKPPEPAPTVAKDTPPRVPDPAPSLVAALHKGSRVSGQLIFQGAARIDGSVDGEIQCHGKLTIGEGAEVKAKISGQIVVVQGRVEGNVTAKEKVELLAPARLFGNISAPRLTITEGVVFDGDCSMGVGKPKSTVAGSQSASAEKAGAAQKVPAES